MNKKFSIVGIYDTETTNYGKGSKTRAFPVLFIVNDISGVDLSKYVMGRDDDVRFYRREEEMLDYIENKITLGRSNSYVPVIAAYNLMFDMQPLMYALASRYKIVPNAQSSQNVYTLDLCNGDGDILLRFWDTWFLEMRGLAAMGETCGIPKALGDWDYNLIRNQDTYLTKDEMHYAARDVQVIPAYLKYLLNANEWMNQSDFGIRVLTKTSLVRKMAEKKIGNRKITKKDRKKLTLGYAFAKLCLKQLPATYEQYALRRTCFRGGLAFTAASTASTVVYNVASLDVTSMHHAFINGRMVPTDFEVSTRGQLESSLTEILSRDLNWVLDNYDNPFDYACHMRIRFDNIRMRKNTCFDKWGIATLSYSKFQSRYETPTETNGFNARSLFAENVLKSEGWHDYALNPEFAYGKLYSADCVILHLSEIELWILGQVYEWDEHDCLFGELTRHFIRPPDYVSLQSNMLYKMKDDMKDILKHYHRGEKYDRDVPDTIPESLGYQIEQGAIDESFLHSYYTSTVKGMFNGIYGTQAQDVYKPDYMCDDSGALEIDKSTVATIGNFDEKQPETCKVLYPYGMRIAGGSRMHLIIAMEMLYGMLGDRVRVTGGDTDSLKVSCAEDVSSEEILEMLQPLHYAITTAISRIQERARETFPDIASDLHDVGCFDVEDCGGSDRYVAHMEAWNKARVSIDVSGRTHVTCAGLRRPPKKYTVEEFANDLMERYSPEEILPMILGYNTFVDPSLSFALEQHIPKPTDVFDEDVTDYRGISKHVTAHESKSLYDTGRWLGATQMNVNQTSVNYKWKHYEQRLDTREKILRLDDNGNPCIYIDGVLTYSAERREYDA